MHEKPSNVKTISGKDFARLRRTTCKSEGNWKHLAKDLRDVEITYWELKCIAQRPKKGWLKPFVRLLGVRDECFAEFLYKSLKWDEERLGPNGERKCVEGSSEYEKTRRYISTLMKGKGFPYLVDGITAGVSLLELKMLAVFGDPAWEEKMIEVVHDKQFAAILMEELRGAYRRRRRENRRDENPIFQQAEEFFATTLRQRPAQDAYDPEEIANTMIVDMSLQSLKLLVLSSFLKSNYASSMNAAIQVIAAMVFNPTAAQTIYFAIFDSLVDSGELFRKQLDDSSTSDHSIPVMLNKPHAEVLQDKPVRQLNPNKRRSTINLKERFHADEAEAQRIRR